MCTIKYREINGLHSGQKQESGERSWEPGMEIIQLKLSDIISEFLCIRFTWFGPSLE